MKNIILISTLLVFAACSSDENKNSNKNQVVKETKKIEKKVQEVKKEIAKEETKEEPKKVTRSGAEIFQACTACHGTNGEKPALKKSKIIKGWDAAKVSAALNGYKDGTYGGSMQALMIGQVGFLSDDEIEAVSVYISKL